MTANDWRNLLIGAGSILEIDPAPLPPLSEVLRAKREARARRIKEAGARRVSESTRLTSLDDLAGRVAELTVERVAELVEQHPQHELIRERVGPLQYMLVFRTPATPAGGA